MADPWTVRLNDKDHPNRSEDFFELCEAHALDAAEVARQLIDAYIAFFDENLHPPTFPVTIVRTREPETIREKRVQYKAKPRKRSTES